MIERIKKIIDLNPKVCILGIANTKEAPTYFYVLLTKVKTELKVLSFKDDIPSFDQLPLDENIPVIIAFTGVGVIYNKDQKELIFNNNPEDYYISSYQTKNENEFTAFARKDQIDPIIMQCKNKKVLVLDVYVGVLNTSLLYPNVFDQKSIQVNDINLTFDDTDLIGFKKETPDLEQTFIIENEERNTLEVFLFSVGLHYFFPSSKVKNHYTNEQLDKNRTDNTYKHQFDLIAKIGAAVFILSLLLNFALNGIAKYKINKTNSLVSNAVNYQNELNMLTKEKERKTALIQMSGFLNPNLLSFYINEIGALIPNELQISSMDVLPVKGNISKDQQVAIDDRSILVSGTTISNNAFTNFVDKLNAMPWVAGTQILGYTKSSNNRSNFKLKIALK